MKNKFIKLSIFFYLFCISKLLSAQNTIIAINGINDAETDNQGNIYVSLKNGTLVKYDSSGQRLIMVSLQPGIPADQLDVSGNFRIYVYYNFEQQYLFLDRNLKTLSENRIQYGNSGFISCSALDEDQNIWFYNQTDFSLIKMNPLLNNIIVESGLNLIFPKKTLEIPGIECYQKRVYLNNNGSEILGFDSFGNYHKSFPVATNAKISFFRNEMYYIQQNSIKAINIYNDEVRVVSETIPEIEQLIKLLVHENFRLLVYDNKITKQYQRTIDPSN